ALSLRTNHSRAWNFPNRSYSDSMKSIAALSLVLLAFVAGCGDSSSSSSSSSTNSVPSTNSSVGPADYYGALARAQQSATKTVDTTAIQKAVDMFQADKGRYPRDL